MKFRIGHRTLKTAVGAALAILIAQSFHLDNYASAGILTILCIKITKKKSLRASWDRILACLIAIVFSIVFFEFIGYHAAVIGLLLLFFIPTVVIFKASDGVASSAVIILHFYSAGEVTVSFIFNELFIILIGIGIALMANLYMPSLDRQIEEYQRKIEGNFKIIFQEIVHYLGHGDHNWDGKEIPETIQLINEAKALSFREMENQFFHNNEEQLYYTYFKIREKQFEIIEKVLPSITSISKTVEQGKMIADFIEELSEHIHAGNTVDINLEKLNNMRLSFENMELPKTREEFAIRAALFHFLNEMEQYLLIKRSFKGIYKQNDMNKTPVGEGN
ncbi:aromatic acid exporter family protein [Niallia sp. Krafla_26]|uniref:aromatic acid exporter family protein n=1 Tax=Niallia sp. Krafla_26 TaxID=3064703 RepID=UPI003D17172B